jgi:hypothetical protein
MATSRESPSKPMRFGWTWDDLLAGRPLLALAVVWLITGGHPMNFREMGLGHGWVAAELYSLQAIFAVAISLTLLACPALGQHVSSRRLTQLGLLLLATASFLNGLDIYAPLTVFAAGRALAGVGVGLVIASAPHLLDHRWENPTTWAAILLPVLAPGAISAASMVHSWSGWEWGFLAEGAAAAVCLVVMLSMAEAPERAPPPPRGSLTFLPFLVLASAALVYCLHWGQLHGWLESADIAVAAAVGTLSLGASLVALAPSLDLLALKDGWVRLLLFFFGGACQFFHGAAMNVYGGSLLNFSSWQRSWLNWSLPMGVATTLAVVRLLRPTWNIRLGLPGAVAGLLILAAGMFHSYERTLDWPYWQIQNVVDLNWFPAPQHWELAPGRFLMGLGIGMFMLAMDTMTSPDHEREKKVRPLLLVAQFYGSGVAVGVLVNFLLIGHPIHYSYVADRDFIQPQELAARRAVLRDALAQAGEAAPDRQAEELMYREVNNEADNLVFAQIYVTFMAAALGLAALCTGLLFCNWRRPPPNPETA